MKCVLTLLVAGCVLFSCTPAHAGTSSIRLRERAAHYAVTKIGKPYRWGSKGPEAFDCSGLVYWSYRRAGRSVPRVTYDQYRKFRHVRYRNLRRGDLVFFYGRGHVGLYLGHGRFVHSPHSGSHVKVSRMRGWYRNHFAGAARP